MLSPPFSLTLSVSFPPPPPLPPSRLGTAKSPPSPGEASQSDALFWLGYAVAFRCLSLRQAFKGSGDDLLDAHVA